MTLEPDRFARGGMRMRSLLVATIAAGLLGVVGSGPADASQTRGDLATKPKVVDIELVCDSKGKHRGRVNLAAQVAYSDVKAGREGRYRNYDHRVRARIAVRSRSSGRVLARIRDRDRSHFAILGDSIRHWHSRLLGRKASRRILRASHGTARCGDAAAIERNVKVNVHALGRLRKSGARTAASASQSVSQRVTAMRSVAVQSATSTPCDMSGRSTVGALTQCRNWTTYAPASLDDNVSDQQLRRDLDFLQGEGFRGIVTYTVAGNMDHAPDIAKSVGFQKVIAGVWDPGSLPPAPGSNPEMHKLDDLLQKPSSTVDAVMLGNEGIARQNFNGASPKWTLQNIQDWVAEFEQAYPQIPVTTSDVWIMYGPPGTIAGKALLGVGDFVFPNLHPFWDNNEASNGLFSANPNLAAEFVSANLQQWFNNTANPVVLHESWWPSAVDFPAGCATQPNLAPPPPPPPDGPQWLPYNDPPYTQPGQRQFFTELLTKKNAKFVWGGALDTPSLYDGCKQPPPAGYGGAPGHHWGLWSQSPDGTSNTPKQAVQSIDYGGY